MVLCASYSGDTEETLACYEAAGALGARRIVVTTGGELAELARADGVPVIPLPGGFQPRAAVAYMTVAALEVAALCGAGPRLTSEIDVAAAHTRAARRRVGARRAGGLAGQGRSPAACTARCPVIAGAGLTTPIAYRWKTQINENAKHAGLLRTSCPSSTTTRSSAGRARASVGRFSAVFLDDSDAHPRVKERIDADRAADRRQRGGELPSGDARADHDRARRSRSCCSAISCRSTSPRCAASIRGRCRSIDELKAALDARAEPRCGGSEAGPRHGSAEARGSGNARRRLEGPLQQ